MATSDDAVILAEELKAVPETVLEDYVTSRLKQFARAFANELSPGRTAQQIEVAYNRAVYNLGIQRSGSAPQLVLKFKHRCRFLGCRKQECHLCKNNPNKRCGDDDSFDNCYADNQVLKAKCEAEITVDLVNKVTGQLHNLPGAEIQVSVIDGEAYNDGSSATESKLVELLKSDEGVCLLGSYGGAKLEADGRLLVGLQHGRGRLTDVFITDKNDTFHSGSQSFSTFRLLARAVCRDAQGACIAIDEIPPAVSPKFVVKTQRALNDYRKSEYPHYKDELTKLRYIGSITAQRLKDVKAFVSPDVPFDVVETVEEFKKLLDYGDSNKQCENKLLELLNMRGRHRHKWEYLRNLLAERIVYDDNALRVWLSPELEGRGLLYPCKQAQVNLDKPSGVVKVVVQGGQPRYQVSPLTDGLQEQYRAWRVKAEEDWNTPSHMGWKTISNEPLDYVGTPNGVGVPATNACVTPQLGRPPRTMGQTQHMGQPVSHAATYYSHDMGMVVNSNSPMLSASAHHLATPGHAGDGLATTTAHLLMSSPLDYDTNLLQDAGRYDSASSNGTAASLHRTWTPNHMEAVRLASEGANIFYEDPSSRGNSYPGPPSQSYAYGTEREASPLHRFYSDPALMTAGGVRMFAGQQTITSGHGFLDFGGNPRFYQNDIGLQPQPQAWMSPPQAVVLHQHSPGISGYMSPPTAASPPRGNVMGTPPSISSTNTSEGTAPGYRVVDQTVQDLANEIESHLQRPTQLSSSTVKRNRPMGLHAHLAIDVSQSPTFEELQQQLNITPLPEVEPNRRPILLYHQESRGRHMPRSRGIPEDLEPIMLEAFPDGGGFLDPMISPLSEFAKLAPLGEETQPDRGGMDGNQSSANLPETFSQKLVMEVGDIAAENPGARALRRNDDNDSFKRLIAPIDSPAGGLVDKFLKFDDLGLTHPSMLGQVGQ